MKVTANEDTSYTIELTDDELLLLGRGDTDRLANLSFSGKRNYEDLTTSISFYGERALNLALEMLHFRGIH